MYLVEMQSVIRQWTSLVGAIEAVVFVEKLGVL